MKTENASMARTFRFTPHEWTAIETECRRLNMSMGFYAKYVMLSAIGKLRPLELKYPFLDESHFRAEGDEILYKSKGMMEKVQ